MGERLVIGEYDQVIEVRRACNITTSSKGGPGKGLRRATLLSDPVARTQAVDNCPVAGSSVYVILDERTSVYSVLKDVSTDWAGVWCDDPCSECKSTVDEHGATVADAPLGSFAKERFVEEYNNPSEGMPKPEVLDLRKGKN